MNTPPPDRCGYTWPEDYEEDDYPSSQSCCWRETASEKADRCVWHCTSDEVTKSVKTLQNTRTRSEAREQSVPFAELLDGADLSGLNLGDAISFENVALRGSNLTGAVLSGVNLINATLSGAALFDATLSGADLRDADLSGADLRDADLSGASFTGADLSDANFTGADLSDANFTVTDLSGVALSGTDLSGAALSGTDLSGAALRDADLSDADLINAILSGAVLFDADLSNADLMNATFAGADLRDADLSGADLRDADLSSAALRDADLSGADLMNATFAGADLRDADLSGADLRDADLSGADLSGADLSGADFRGEVLSEDVSVNGATTCRRLKEGYDIDERPAGLSVPIRFQRIYKKSWFDSEDWDATARAYHSLKMIFADHGLVGKARRTHVQERRARSNEAKAANGWRDRRYLGSLPSRVFTEYGVGVGNLLFWMVALFLISTAVYVDAGVRDTLVANFAYSVLAFTVAPPPPMPSQVGAQLMMMVETFFGTLSIVLLGYVLGNREQF